jgi:uncharacterized Tic20 family protein
MTMADDNVHDEVPGINEPWDAAPPPPPPAYGVGRAQSPEDIRMWTLLAHGSAFIGAFFGLAFMGPLVVWLIRRDVDQISGLHAKEALNFNLSVLVYGVVSFVAVFVIIGIPMLLALGIFWVVNVVRAMIAVSSGQTFVYPLTLRLIK